MKKYKLVVFDMDGTILDTLEDLKTATNHALKRYDMPERSLEEVRAFVGNGIRKLMERAVVEGTSGDLFEKVLNEFQIFYKKHSMDTTKPYNGIVDLLRQLKKLGYKTAVVSNKIDFAVQDLVQDFFEGLFDMAVGDRPDFKKKPSADSVKFVMRSLGVKPEETIYIGDSDVDLQTAKNADLDCIAVEWGFRDRLFLEEHGATNFAKQPEDILTFLEK
ncbi:MAG: HAD family hydrolase [Wujia sp.]